MTSPIERLAGKDTGQAMDYEEELVHNAPAIAQNAIISMAKKVKDNTLSVMAVPIIMLQPNTLQNQSANPLHALLKVPNALDIK